MLPVGKGFFGKGSIVGQVATQSPVGLVVRSPEPKDGLLRRLDLALDGLPVLCCHHEVARALTTAEVNVDVGDLMKSHIDRQINVSIKEILTSFNHLVFHGMFEVTVKHYCIVKLN